jgi:hypothetical protein
MPYLSLRQASETTGKSERTIRRLCNAPKSKDYVTYESGKILIDANYLEQNYPMSKTPEPVTTVKEQTGQRHDMDSHIVNQQLLPNDTGNLAHRVAMLELELKYKDEFYHKITAEKDLRIETLERSLLLLGEGLKKEPVASQEQLEQVTQELVKKKRWWFW